MLSIIVPVYNSEKYLIECINSIINQPFKDFELILVNDGSNDNSGQICDDFAKKDNRIKIIHKKNGGVSSARNAGIGLAKGEYVCFVDSDDVISKNALSILANDIDLYYSDLFIYNYSKKNEKNKISFIDNEIKEGFYSKEEGFKDINVIHKAILTNKSNSSCAKAFNLKMIKENNILFRNDVKLGEDFLFVFDFFKKCNSVYCSNESIYLYRYNESSAVNNAKLCYIKDIDIMYFEQINNLSNADILKQINMNLIDTLYSVIYLLKKSKIKNKEINSHLDNCENIKKLLAGEVNTKSINVKRFLIKMRLYNLLFIISNLKKKIGV